MHCLEHGGGGTNVSNGIAPGVLQSTGTVSCSSCVHSMPVSSVQFRAMCCTEAVLKPFVCLLVVPVRKIILYIVFLGQNTDNITSVIISDCALLLRRGKLVKVISVWSLVFVVLVTLCTGFCQRFASVCFDQLWR